MAQLKIHNHYVPQFYLKNWSKDLNSVNVYYSLVANKNVPLWVSKSIRGVAAQDYLYTQVTKNGDSDEIENWLEHKFETPAKNAIDKVINNLKLSREDWHCLINFLASQIVRTPAMFIKQAEIFDTQFFSNALQKSAIKLEQYKNQYNRSGKLPEIKAFQYNLLPLKVSTISQDESETKMEVKASVGRNQWLWEIKHLLKNTINVLYKHQWLIINSTEGIEWPTTDNPVVLLNYYNNNKYDFNGGWNKRGTEIFMPLSPNHIIYTQVGNKDKTSRLNNNPEACSLLQRLIIEHSFQNVFAKDPIKGITFIKPRIVSNDLYSQQKEILREWNKAQSQNDLDFL